VTYTLLPFRETKPVNPSKLHEGPYYGHALKALLDPKPSCIERLTLWYENSLWAPLGLAVLGCALLGAAIVLATWMVMP
jgi:hypothetical protein